MKSRIKKLYLALSALSAIAFFSGCGINKGDNASLAQSTSANAAVIEAFTQLQSLCQPTQGNCAACHGASGIVKPWCGPASSVWPTMVADFNPSNPSQSYIFTKSQDSHYGSTGHLLGASTWIAAITKVTTAMNEAGSAAVLGNFITPDQTIASTLPTFSSGNPLNTKNYSLMTYPLSSFGAAFAHVTIQFKIALEPTAINPNTYIIYDPRVVNNGTEPVHLATFYFNLNDKTDSVLGLNYAGISIYANNGEEPLISPLTMLLPQGTADKLSISVMTAEEAALPQCQNVSNFTNNIFPIFSQPNMLLDGNNNVTGNTCVSCHTGTSNQTAVTTFNMGLSDQGALCASFLERVNTVTPEQSALLYEPTNTIHNGNILQFTPAERTTILNFIANP